jgi:hypothetical protein
MPKQRTTTIDHPRPVLGVALLCLAAFMVALFLSWVATADAQTPGDPALLVTDYEAYPNGEDTAALEGCDAGGILMDQDGAGYTLNGGPLVSSLAALGPLATGDVVTATFVATEACQGSVVSLTIKDAEQESFDPTTNQTNVGYEAVVAGEGLTTVELTLPALPDDCFYQADHVVGYPLAVVGPDGSFYSPVSRGDEERNMLVDARNGTLTSCTAVTTTTTTEPPASTTTTTAPTTTTTAQSTTTTQPRTITTAGPTTTTVQSTATSIARTGTIPVTGSSPAPLLLIGALVLSLGSALSFVGWRRGRA